MGDERSRGAETYRRRLTRLRNRVIERSCFTVFLGAGLVAALPVRAGGSGRPPGGMSLVIFIVVAWGFAWMFVSACSSTWRLWVWSGRAGRLARGKCPWCGYPRESASAGVCPECGRDPLLDEDDDT
ncbi:MAG: hypothetical protein R3B57_08305 [Phycisphaerales bacterium]